MADDLTLELEHGRLTIAREAVSEIVAETALGCYGVVGLTAGSRVGACSAARGSRRRRRAARCAIELHVVVEHGLNLAEVASTIRSQVAYELERLTGLTVAAVEVHIQRVRQSA